MGWRTRLFALLTLGPIVWRTITWVPHTSDAFGMQDVVVNLVAPNPATDNNNDDNNRNSNMKETIKNQSKAQDHSWTHEWLVKGTQGQPARILFVHVGKTGGESLRLHVPLNSKEKAKAVPCIQKSYASNSVAADEGSNYNSSFFEETWLRCFPKAKRERSALARRTVAYRHITIGPKDDQRHDQMLPHINTFLITVRNPVSRIVSAFNYHRHLFRPEKAKLNDKKNMHFLGHRVAVAFYKLCFPTMDHVAQSLMNETTLEPDIATTTSRDDQKNVVSHIVKSQRAENTTTTTTTTNHLSSSCVTLAKQLLYGQPAFFHAVHHIPMNYRFYYEKSLKRRPEVPVVVVRTEHLWEDATRLEVALGGRGAKSSKGRRSNFRAANARKSHGSEKYKVKSGISTAAGKKAICCHIFQELIIHQKIVLAALNLNHTEKAETLQAPMRDCGVVVVVVAHQSPENNLVDTPFDWNVWHSQNCLLPRKKQDGDFR